MSDKYNFNLDNAKVKKVERSRGRMKIQIKLNREEAEGFKNFSMIKPEDLDELTFYKQIFFAGCNAMTEQIQSMIAKRQEELELQKEKATESTSGTPTETQDGKTEE